MKTEQYVYIFISCFALFCGIALSFVKINKEELKGKAHTMPGIALFRFPAYRYFMVIVCAAISIFSFSLGFGLF